MNFLTNVDGNDGEKKKGEGEGRVVRYRCDANKGTLNRADFVAVCRSFSKKKVHDRWRDGGKRIINNCINISVSCSMAMFDIHPFFSVNNHNSSLKNYELNHPLYGIVS